MPFFRIGWNQDGTREVVELDLITKGDAIPPMYGDVKTEENANTHERTSVLEIDHRDGDWHQRLRGTVQSSELIQGQMFAKSLKSEELSLEGRWTMRWVREE